MHWQIFILLNIVKVSIEIQYEFDFEDDHLITKCLDKPAGFSDVDGLFDFSNFTMELGEEGVVGSGNLTTVWDVEPTDRIETRITTLHLERGVWQPTILNILITDFCKVMYDKNQIWYGFMTEHVINVEEVRNKGVRYKGTVLLLERYLMKASFGCGISLPLGRHRVVVTMVAIDLNNVRRPNGICYEFIGTFYKTKKM